MKSFRERFLEALLESAVDYAIIALDLDGLVTSWNQGAQNILGWTEAEMLGRPASLFFTLEDRQQGIPQAEMQAALSRGRGNDERWHQRQDGTRFWANGEMMPLKDEDGSVQGFLKILRDRTAQRDAAERQRADAEFLRSVLAASGDCIKVLDLDARLIFMTEGGQRIMEVSDFNAIRGCPWPDFWQDQGHADALAAVAAAKAGGIGRFQGEAATMAGTPRWWDVQVTPMLGADGLPERLLSVSRDITATRRAEEALRGAQGMNTPILNSSRDCIVVLDLDGHTRFVSPGGIEAMEIADVDAIIGLSWLRVWHGDDHAAARAAVAAARDGGSGRFQGFCPTHRGTPKWWDVVISPLAGPDGQPERLVSVGRDITALKQAEQNLARSEERYRTLTETLPQLVWTCRPDGSCDYLSRQWVDYTGVPEAAQLGMEWVDMVIHPDDRARSYDHWMGAVAGRHPYDIEYRIRGANGDYRWFKTRGTAIRDADGAVRQWFGTCTDIQDIVEAREVLTRTRAELERQVDERTRERDRAWKNSQDLQLVVDGAGIIRAANEAWTTLLGWRADEVVGRHHLTFNHPDDRDAGAAALAAAARGALPPSELRCAHKDGSYRWISWVATLEEGLIYASGRHVTAEREAAAALAAMQEQLRQSQKMEAVGQLTGGLAHDFNNLLTGIIGSLELIQTRIAQGRLADLDRYILAAQGASKRAAALTHRLLAFSRRQTLDPRPTGVNRLVAEMDELIRRTAGPAVHVETVGASGLWTTLVDPNQLENALLNLCINARDAMPDGGRLTIETANRWLDERAARERDLPPGQYVALSVSDTGTGMSPEVIKLAFDPFFTTKPLGMGTGLGLSMVYGFARQSGGQVRIYSEVGAGTAVSLYLPRHFGAEETADSPAASRDGARAGDGETVLVVDDEPTVRMLVGEVLGELGYTTIEAADGAAGLQVLQSGRRIDLLVTDVGLPGGMNGRQLADAGRTTRPGLKVLFITGYAENAVIGHGHLEPGMQVLTKPFAMETLATRIRELIAQR